MKIGITADKTKKETFDKKQIYIQKFGFIDLDSGIQSNVEKIIVLGGDGFLLHSVRSFINTCNTFYGLNFGTIGFLLNEVPQIDENLIKEISTSETTIFKPLEVEIENDDGIYQSFAMNEVSVFRETGQVAKIKISIDKQTRMPNLFCDGVVLATSAGSTAYNFSLHGQIFSPNENVLSLCPVAPFRPRHWRGALLSSSSVVDFEILEREKRPSSATVDFIHFTNVKKVCAKQSKSLEIKLLFKNQMPFREKILMEQFLQF